MLKPICVRCHFFMRPVRNGIYILEIAQEMPYKLWMADILGCPICGRTIVYGFGQKSIAEHFDKKMYEVILDDCFNGNARERIPIVMAYDNLDYKDCYELLNPDPMTWLERYCKTKIDIFNKKELRNLLYNLDKQVDNGV